MGRTFIKQFTQAMYRKCLLKDIANVILDGKNFCSPLQGITPSQGIIFDNTAHYNFFSRVFNIFPKGGVEWTYSMGISSRIFVFNSGLKAWGTSQK